MRHSFATTAATQQQTAFWQTEMNGFVHESTEWEVKIQLNKSA
jgi:regulation of enolase protein 1 (concanavalin A-like superfamily)